MFSKFPQSVRTAPVIKTTNGCLWNNLQFFTAWNFATPHCSSTWNSLIQIVTKVRQRLCRTSYSCLYSRHIPSNFFRNTEYYFCEQSQTATSETTFFESESNLPNLLFIMALYDSEWLLLKLTQVLWFK